MGVYFINFLPLTALSRRNCRGAFSKNFAVTCYVMVTKKHPAQNWHQSLSRPIFLGSEDKNQIKRGNDSDFYIFWEIRAKNKKNHKSQNFQKTIFHPFYMVSWQQYTHRRGF